MDPNANLIEQRRVIAEIMAIRDACDDDGAFSEDQELELVDLACRLADLNEALDGWLSLGGFLPKLWDR